MLFDFTFHGPGEVLVRVFVAAVTKQLVGNCIRGDWTLFRFVGAPSQSVKCLPGHATGVGKIHTFHCFFPSFPPILIKMFYEIVCFVISFRRSARIYKLVILHLAFLVPCENVRFSSPAGYALCCGVQQ